MKECDCGSKSTDQPGHSHWCNSLENEYIAWQEFLDMIRHNYGGASYMYVTDDSAKLNRPIVFGNIVQADKAIEALNSGTNLHELWIENSAHKADEVYDLAMKKMGRQSIVRFLSLREKE